MSSSADEVRMGQDFLPGVGIVYTLPGNSRGDLLLVDSTGVPEPPTIFFARHKDRIPASTELERGFGATFIGQDSLRRLESGARVDPAALHERLCSRAKRYLLAPTEVFDLLAAFTMLSHVFMVGQSVPYLHVTGAPGTGKSLLAELLEPLLFHPLMASGITAAAMYRLLDAIPGSLVIDEQGSGDARWHAVLRAGYRKTGVSVSSHKGPALAVFASLMGPPSRQAHGTTPRGEAILNVQGHGARRCSGSWDHPVSQAA